MTGFGDLRSEYHEGWLSEGVIFDYVARDTIHFGQIFCIRFQVVESFAAQVKPAAEAVLRVVRGPQTGVSYRLGDDAIQTIGRSPQCDVFLNDMTVSREHAVIEPLDGTFSIRDTNSFNGVWVNNANVEDKYILTHGDIIQIGAFCLIYQEE